MGYWSIVVPEATKNYVSNPSLENDTTGYTNLATGTAVGTRARSTTWQRRGVWSYRIEKTGGGASDLFGYIYTISAAADLAEFQVGDFITVSVDLDIQAGTTVRVQLNYNDGTPRSVTIFPTTSGRHSVTSSLAIAGALASLNFSVSVNNATGIFYADGHQLERKSAAYATTYCDGEQEGCSWTGIPHNSKSIRSASKSLGGRQYNLDDLGYYVTNVSGIGMPPINLLTQLQALLPGALLRDYTVGARTIQLVSIPQPTSQADLHSKRKDFVDFIRPDRSGSIKPFLLRYTGANSSKPVEIEVVYDSGLEYNAPATGFAEELPLRLLAPYPYWREEGNRAYSLSYTKTLASHNCIIAKEDGEWQLMGTGLGGATKTVNVIKKGLDGRIYVGAFCDNLGGVATTRGIGVWNPETDVWASLNGQVAAAGQVHDFAFAANGDIIAVGNFTDMAGVANTQHIAKWNKATSTWTSITGTVANNAIYGAEFDHQGNLYVVGDFTAIGGVGAVRIAKYDGSAWSALGTGLNARGQCLACSPDGYMYVGGLFTTANGVTVNYIAKWNGTTFEALVSGGQTGVSLKVTSPVRVLRFTSDGSLYVGGIFETANGEDIYRIAKWNGVQFSDLADGVWQGNITSGIGIVDIIDENTDTGNIVLLGYFDTAGGRTGFDAGAIWNQSIYVGMDFNVPVDNIKGRYLDDETMYLGWSTSSAGALNDAIVSELTTITYEGTTEVSPIISIKRSGGTTARIRWIENLTTGTTLWLDHKLLDGETLTIDLTPGERSVKSSIRSDSWQSLLQASNLTRFTLQPGENKIKVFIDVSGSPTIAAFMIVPLLHWAIDGVAT